MMSQREAPGVVLSEAAQWRLIDLVYSDAQLLWTNLLLVSFLGELAVARSPAVWTIGWMVVGVVIAITRLLDFRSFRRRRASISRDRARFRYTVLAWVLGAHWGIANLVLVLTDDRVLTFWFTSLQAAFLAAALSRSNPVSLAAKGQVLLVLLPMAAVCLASGDVFLRAYTPVVALYLISSLMLVNTLHRQTVRLLVADETNAHLLRTVELVNVQLQAVALTDGLTGLANRRSFDQALHREWSRSARGGGELGLLMVDIDHFKEYNDTLGHQAGDEALRRVASCIDTAIMRPGDTAARYGGEEFAVILPDTDLFGAVDIAERIRASVEAMNLSAATGHLGMVTVSVGASAVRAPEADGDPARLTAAADRELYRAKHDTRNCVRAARLEDQPAYAVPPPDPPLAPPLTDVTLG